MSYPSSSTLSPLPVNPLLPRAPTPPSTPSGPSSSAATQVTHAAKRTTAVEGWQSWQILLGLAGVAAAGLGVLYYAYLQSGNGKTSSKKKKGGRSTTDNIQTTLSPPSYHLATSSLPQDLASASHSHEQRSRCEDEMGHFLSQGPEYLARFNISPYRTYLSQMAAQDSPSPDAATALLRLLVSYHTLRGMSVTRDIQDRAEANPSAPVNQTELKQWEVEQTRDLTQAWEILLKPSLTEYRMSAMPFSNNPAAAGAAALGQPVANETVSTAVMACEVAQRLKNMTYLSAAYEKLAAIPATQRSAEEVVTMFISAPLLGKWNDTTQLGQQLLQQDQGPTIMEDFHLSALESPLMTDWKCVYQKSKDWSRQSRSRGASRSVSSANSNAQQQQEQKSSLSNEVFDVTDVSITHDQSFSPNPLVHAMLQQMVAQNREPVHIRPGEGELPFQVTGALARMMCPYQIPLMCAGRYDAQSFHLAAYGKVQAAEGNPTQDPDNPDHVTWWEIDIEQRLETSMDQGKQKTYNGQLRFQNFEVDANGSRGPLSLMHQWNMELQMKRQPNLT